MTSIELLVPELLSAGAFILVFLILSAIWRSLIRSISRRSGRSRENSFWDAASIPGHVMAAAVSFFFYCEYSGMEQIRPQIYTFSRFFLNGALILLIGEILFTAALRYYSDNKSDQEIPSIFRQLVKGIIYLVIFLSFLSHTYKVDITPLLTTSAVFTMILGLALQDVLGNFFAGISVHISPPFRLGDWVKINDTFGKVIESNWRATTLRLANTAIVSIPNNQISKNEITNYSDGKGAVFKEFKLGLSYDVSPERIRRILIASARQVEEIYTRPSPVIVLEKFDDYSINYKIRFWMSNDGSPDRVTAQLASRIWYRLKREGLSIPFPIQDIFVHHEKDDHQRTIEHRLALISGIDFLTSIDARLKTFIAERLEECWYETGEEIVTEGAFDTDFYLIDRGRVNVMISSAGSRPVAELGEGDFFGEMSLLTGEKRSASVVAKVETRLLKLNRDSMGLLLSENKELAEKLSFALAERASKNAQLKNGQEVSTAAPGKGKPDENAARAAILRRICSFFKL